MTDTNIPPNSLNNNEDEKEIEEAPNEISDKNTDTAEGAIKSPYESEGGSLDDVIFDEDSELGNAEVIKKLRNKIKIATEEKQKYLDNWQRDKAEFINARKRDDESKAEFLKFSKLNVIEDILPVLDSFDMAIMQGSLSNKSGEGESNVNNLTSNISNLTVSKEWKVGFEGIYNQLLNVLSKHNVLAFGKVGDIFDPNLHHSIGLEKTENKNDDQKIANIAQKGYIMADKVIRPALVKVWEV